MTGTERSATGVFTGPAQREAPKGCLHQREAPQGCLPDWHRERHHRGVYIRERHHRGVYMTGTERGTTGVFT